MKRSQLFFGLIIMLLSLTFWFMGERSRTPKELKAIYANAAP